MLLDAGWTIQNFRELNFAAGIVRPQLGLKSSPERLPRRAGRGLGAHSPHQTCSSDCRKRFVGFTGFPPLCAIGGLKPALVLPRVSKRLTMGRSAEGEIKHACRLGFLRRVSRTPQ
jgi:hypothetical protein